MYPAEIPQISHDELTDLEAIGKGGFGVAYRAKHARFGTVVYQKMNAVNLADRYLTSLFLFCYLAVLDPKVGHTMDVLSPCIPILCNSD